jgi:transcriptional regulator with XRE-family HTH domain
MNLERFASILRQRREELGITQQHIVSRLGVSQSTVARWELAERTPSGPHMLRLCHLLRISVEEVMA